MTVTSRNAPRGTSQHRLYSNPVVATIHMSHKHTCNGRNERQDNDKGQGITYQACFRYFFPVTSNVHRLHRLSAPQSQKNGLVPASFRACPAWQSSAQGSQQPRLSAPPTVRKQPVHHADTVRGTHLAYHMFHNCTISAQCTTAQSGRTCTQRSVASKLPLVMVLTDVHRAFLQLLMVDFRTCFARNMLTSEVMCRVGPPRCRGDAGS